MLRIHVLAILPLLLAVCSAQDGAYADLDAGVEAPSACNELYEWQCGDGTCIAKYDVCSGIIQCPDGSDESELTCPDQPGLDQPPRPKQQKPHHPTVQPARKVQIQPKHNATAITKVKAAANGASLKIVTGGLFLLLGLSALVHFLLKKRRSRMDARNIRRGEKSLMGDEDEDLLLYA
ncbi:Dehydrogenase [Aphelenchoides fujianensis]|nr:Dehydrogenase [Aphelenchoides fujianensis]